MFVHVFNKDGLGKKGTQMYSPRENQLPKHTKDLYEIEILTNIFSKKSYIIHLPLNHNL